MNALASPAPGTELTNEGQPQSAGLLAQIVSLAANPDVNAANLTALADLAITLQGIEQKQEFNRDFSAAVMEMPVISRDGRIVIKDKNTGRITQSTPFARFEDIDRIVRPIANRHNLAYTFEVGGTETRITVCPIVWHSNGFVHHGKDLPLPLETSGSKNNVQGVGSSITFGKRYALCAAFSIVTEGLDTDGNGSPSANVSLPHEREQLVLAEAEGAAAAGRYQAHFDAQSPRDRAWLVQHGHHARLGGAALPPPPDSGPPPSPPPPPVDPDKARAEWCRKYIVNVDKASSMDELSELRVRQEDKLSSIREGYPALQQQIVAAHERAEERLR